MRPKSDAANDINKMASTLLLLQTIRIRCATQKALRALFSVTESQRLQPGGQCHIAWDQGGVGWGRGTCFWHFFTGKSRIDQQVVWRGRIWKKIHQQQLHYNVGPCVAKSVTPASVEMPSKKFTTFVTMSFRHYIHIVRKKTPFLEEISLKSKNLVTKGLNVWVLCVWIGRIYPTWWPNILQYAGSES